MKYDAKGDVVKMNRAIELADGLIARLTEENDNAADVLAGIAVAVRRMQGYSDHLILTINPTLRRWTWERK